MTAVIKHFIVQHRGILSFGYKLRSINYFRVKLFSLNFLNRVHLSCQISVFVGILIRFPFVLIQGIIVNYAFGCDFLKRAGYIKRFCLCRFVYIVSAVDLGYLTVFTRTFIDCFTILYIFSLTSDKLRIIQIKRPDFIFRLYQLKLSQSGEKRDFNVIVSVIVPGIIIKIYLVREGYLKQVPVIPTFAQIIMTYILLLISVFPHTVLVCRILHYCLNKHFRHSADFLCPNGKSERVFFRRKHAPYIVVTHIVVFFGQPKGRFKLYRG